MIFFCFSSHGLLTNLIEKHLSSVTLVDALVDGMADDCRSVIVSMRLPALRETPQTNRKTKSFTEVSIQAGIPQEKEPFQVHVRAHFYTLAKSATERAGEPKRGLVRAGDKDPLNKPK
jgi:hypothetical protein